MFCNVCPCSIRKVIGVGLYSSHSAEFLEVAIQFLLEDTEADDIRQDPKHGIYLAADFPGI